MANAFIKKIANAKSFRQKFPEPIKKLGRFFLPREEYTQQIWLAENPYANGPRESDYPGIVKVRLGIIEDFTGKHHCYITACRDMRVPYKLINISGADWIDQIRESGCDAFLVWPSCFTSIWKNMFEERLKIISEVLNKIIYPSYNEIWSYESKRKMHYWVASNGLPHPKTWVFYDKAKAIEFAGNTELPIVTKTDLGSGSSGVKVFRNRSSLVKYVKKCFKKGIQNRVNMPFDVQWGNILFQRYIADAREWRMIRIGDSFFGYEKIKVGDSASGSHKWHYERPGNEILNFLKEVTDKSKFRSMDIDVFATPDGKFLISELQTVFGMGNPWEMCVVDGKAGRMIYKEGKWEFEEGSFCDNYMCNLRIQDLLGILGYKVPLMAK